MWFFWRLLTAIYFYYNISCCRNQSRRYSYKSYLNGVHLFVHNFKKSTSYHTTYVISYKCSYQ